MSVSRVNNDGSLSPIATRGQFIQYLVMPTPSVDILNKIVQYIGTSTSSYINGYFYKCIYDETVSPAIYRWDNVSVQAGGSGGGAVDSVNGKTGTVILDAKDIGFQYNTMPTASVDYLNQIIQYTGTTNSTYTNGYFYKCTTDGSTYSWENVEVQSGSAGSDNVVEGYFNSTDNLFYEESTYITPITGANNVIYISLDTNSLYRYNGSIFIRVDEVIISGKMNTDGSNSSYMVTFSESLTVGNRNSSSNIGRFSVAEGYNITASGDYSHAEGYSSVASGDYSHAEGLGTNADGSQSHAEGNETNARGANSHAEGSQTSAYGGASHAEGYYTNAQGDYSHAGGYYTTAYFDYQTVIGKHNNNKSTTLFEVGNGTSNNAKSNAFEVYSDGKFSLDNGTTKFKFTSYNGNDGYYDASGTFHTFGGVEWTQAGS